MFDCEGDIGIYLPIYVYFKVRRWVSCAADL